MLSYAVFVILFFIRLGIPVLATNFHLCGSLALVWSMSCLLSVCSVVDAAFLFGSLGCGLSLAVGDLCWFPGGCPTPSVLTVQWDDLGSCGAC